MSGQVLAPWAPDVVQALGFRQRVGHPYTCPAHSTTALVPTRDGWVCPLGGCGYRQAWALATDANPERWRGCGQGDMPAAEYCMECPYGEDCRWWEHDSMKESG